MTEDEVREIVRSEIAKMIDEAGIIPALVDLVSQTLAGIPGLTGTLLGDINFGDDSTEGAH